MGQWIERTPMPKALHDMQAITVDGRIYVISGADEETYDTVNIYDPDSDSWNQGPPIPSKRGWFGAALLDGYIYAIAGKRLRSSEEKERTGDIGNYEIRDSVVRLDLATATWSSVESISEPRAGVVATVCAGKIYAIGGNAMNNETRSGGPHLDRVEVYDPDTGHWSMSKPLPVGVQGPSVSTFDDRVYVTSGLGGEGASNHSWVMDPAVGRWEKFAPIPTGRCDSAVVNLGRKMYTFGGGGGDPRHDRVEVYDVDSDTWSNETPMPQKIAWGTAAPVGERIFVMGGAGLPPSGKGITWLDNVYELVL